MLQPNLASSCGMQYSAPRSWASRQVIATFSAETPVQRMILCANWLVSEEMRPDSRMLVLTNVGHRAVTLIPLPDNSAARVSDSDSVPALLTL